MSDAPLINREVELDKLLNGLTQKDDRIGLFSIAGQTGIGKTTLVRQLWSLLKEIDTPFVWLSPKGIGKEWFEKWPLLLTQAIQVNRDELVSLKEMINSKLESIYEGTGEGEATTYPFDYQGFSSQASLDQCQKWVRLLIKGIYKAYDDYEEKRGQELRVIFVLDDYDDFSPEYRKFFHYSIVKAFEELDPDLDVRYIISGKKAFKGSAEIQEDWPALFSHLSEVALEVFTKRDILSYLNFREIPGKFLDPVYEACKGIPGQLEAAIEKVVGIPKNDATKGAEGIGTLFEGKTEVQKKWLLWAGYLKRVTVEGLQLFRAPEEVLEAFSWLREQEELSSTGIAGGFEVAEPVCEGIVNWHLSSTLKDKYQDYAHRVAVYDEVLRIIPQLESRERLADLSHFNHFNMDLVRIIFSKQEKELTRFIERDNDQYLMKKRFTMVIKPEFNDAIKTYLDLFPHKQRKDLFAKIGNLWKAKSEDLKKRLDEADEKLKKSNKEREKNEQEIAACVTDIKKQEALIRHYEGGIKAAKETLAGVMKPKGSPSAYIFLMVAMGVLLLYFGVIFAENVSVISVALGAGLIIGGVIWAGDAVSKPSGSPTKSRKVLLEEKAIREKAKTVLRILKSRKDDLDKKRNTETYNLTKYKNQREELDDELNEAYII
ncbi:MAG: hypothetical protein CO175_05690 [Verrucomicrobia bacterium CG_4_9_14_3_um_filter_43_20]|nr:MAG: hypothetical protein COX01_04510 [Verrucomicrobia bacterium CG22_combo_CG10-13_8_21_14_all_43_17]PIY61007.1 MAG: hypothetical protein COY94_07320 [Verrucomicrobia bacterium CG_4_10_14_0_8_um_filter_43_34]PJA43848.1 MAG: hypothetical protein CO175_05690 [Verrucomicrobia bacterium CG_4_9_14_3_um_filter_43_20]